MAKIGAATQTFLVAEEWVTALSGNANRNFISLQNTGLVPVYYAFNSQPKVGDGFILYPNERPEYITTPPKGTLYLRTLAGQTLCAVQEASDNE